MACTAIERGSSLLRNDDRKPIVKQRVDDLGELVRADVGLGRAGLVDDAERRAPGAVEDVERGDSASGGHPCARSFGPPP